MTTGRDPGGGADRPRGGLGGADLPYLVVIAVALGVLVPFVALAHPLSPRAAGTPTTIATTTTAPTTTTTGVLPDAARGAEIFNGNCLTCHEDTEVAVGGLTFAADFTDAEMLAFLIAGLLETDPRNTQGEEMPPRGGNPELTDADLMDVVAYLRTLGG